MKKIYSIVLFFALTVSFSVTAQKKKNKNDLPKDRIEYNLEENGYSGSKMYMFPMDSSGFVLLLRDLTDGSYIFKKFNSNLTEMYEVTANCEKWAAIYDKLEVNGKIYLLVQGSKYGSAQLLEFNPQNKKMLNIDCNYEKDNYNFQMFYKDGSMIITSMNTISAGKQLGKTCVTLLGLGIPALFGSLNFPTWINVGKVNLTTKKFMTETIDDFGKKPHTQFLGGNAGFEGRPGNIVFKSAPKSKKAQVYTKSFKINNGEIKLGESVELNIDKKKEIYTATVNNYSETDKLVLGNYGNKGYNHFGTSESEIRMKGVYFSKMEGKRQRWIKTMEYKEFLPKNQIIKFRRPLNFGFILPIDMLPLYVTFYKRKGFTGTQLLMHDVIETENEFISVGETRTAKWRIEIEQDMQISVSARGGSSASNQVRKVLVFDGYEYNGFVVNCFDKEGKLLWNKAMKYDVKMTSYSKDREFLTVSPEGDKLAFSYFNGTKVAKYYLDEDNKFSDKPIMSKEAKIGSKVDEKKNIKYSYDYVKWTDDTYLVYGVAQIKTSKAELKKKRDAKGNKIKKRRTVLYISKVKVATDDEK